MSFEANDKKVYDLLKDKMYFMPINQRKYVWNENNWQELIDDLNLVYDEKTKDHFIGSLVLKTEDVDDGIRLHYSIIDGQQRLSTLTILECVVGVLFIRNNDKGKFLRLKELIMVKNRNYEEYPIISEKANKSIFNLVSSVVEMGDSYFNSNKEIISNDELLSSKPISKPIRECYSYIYKQLENKLTTVDSIDKYQQIIENVRYIDIIALNNEDAFTIFEILNARGQSLKDFELLKNFMFKYSEEKKEFYEQVLNGIEQRLGDKTEVFLKHFVMHKYGCKTGKEEKRPYKVIVSAQKGKDQEEFLLDLELKSKYYNKILCAEGCTENEKKIFLFFKTRRQQQFRPLILGLMHQKELGTITFEEYEKALSFLYTFFICYNIIGEENSNKIEDVVYTYSGEFENNFSKTILEKFKKSIMKRLPSKPMFINKIKGVGYGGKKWKAYSGARKAENIKAIFELIEREKGTTCEFDGKINIEHIMPESQSEQNVVIGNLMLLEMEINEKCKDKPLVEKVEYYRESKLFFPQQVAERYDYHGEFNIGERTDEIAELLYEIVISPYLEEG